MNHPAHSRLPHRTALGRLALVLALLPFALLVHSAYAIGAWADTGDMTAARQFHTATLLPGGTVLVAGGYQVGMGLASAELYNPTTGNWTATGDMTTARFYDTATLLPNGKVLVVGGRSNAAFLASAELYNPTTGNWTATGSLAGARSSHTATLLPNGTVLVAGGDNGSVNLATAELYDPATGRWTATGSMAGARTSHSATLLPNGIVLVAGGDNGSGSLKTAELYDPATGRWTATGSLLTNHGDRATLLTNGKVLIAGGLHYPNYLGSAEVYDPVSGTWSATGSMTTVRSGHTLTLLPGGKVLAAGAAYLRSGSDRAELYDPTTGTWTPTASMTAVRGSHTATLLRDGTVLVAGGYQHTGASTATELASAELYDPAAQSPTAPTITTQPVNQSVSVPAAATFTAVAASHGGSGLVSQWQVSTDSGATWGNVYDGPGGQGTGPSTSYTTPATTAAMNGYQYRVVFTDNAGSVTSAAVTLSVGCSGGKKADIASPTGGRITTAAQTFTWGGGVCVAQYYFYIGNNPGQTDLYAAGPLDPSVTSATISPAIPLDGRVIYVRLWSLVSGTWQAVDRTYAMGACSNPTRADITTPSGGSVSSGTPTFAWGGGSCVTQYYLYVGSRFGQADLFAAGPLSSSTTSATVSLAIPVDGRTIYVRLWSLVNGQYQAVDHSYLMGGCQNPSKADISSPAGGTLHGANQTFSWSNGACVTQYYLFIGTSYGSTDLYNSGPLASGVTAQSVSGLPTNGGTIYLRLWSLVNGNWQAVDHSYVTAP